MAHNYSHINQGMNWPNYPQQQEEPSYFMPPSENTQSNEDFFPTIDLTQVYDPATSEVENDTQISKRIMILDELIRTYSVDNSLTDFNTVQPPAPMNPQPQYKLKRTRRYQATATATSTSPAQMNRPSTSYQPYRQSINNINIQTQNFNLPMKPNPANYQYYANEVKHSRKQRSNLRITELQPQNWNAGGYEQSLPAIEPVNRITEVIPEAVTSAQSQLNLINHYNIAALSQIGQEILVEIVQSSEEMFQILKLVQQTQNTTDENYSKMQKNLRSLQSLFNRLELVCSKCCDSSKLLDLGKLDGELINRLLNYKENPNMMLNGHLKHADLRGGLEEQRRLQEEALMKNSELKLVLDKLRLIIWDFNSLHHVKKEPGTNV